MKYALVGLALVAAVVGFVLWQNQDKRLILEGTLQKVRVQSVDESNTAAVVEVRIVATIRAQIITVNGWEGVVVGLAFRDKIAPRKTVAGQAAARRLLPLCFRR